MGLLEYNLTHPYPRGNLFTVVIFVIMALIMPPLVLVNVITVGYELVPTLRPTFTPNDTVPSWWASTHLPPSLRRKPPKCQPNDMGRGDVFRVTPSLFEYRVLSTWNKPEFYAKDQGIIPYTGAPFDDCTVNSMRFDHNMQDWTQSVIVGVQCFHWPVWSYLETRIDFAEQISRDYMGQYYGHYTDLPDFFQENPNDYRVSVFGVLDTISTDSLRIIRGQHLPAPALSLSIEANVSTFVGDNPWFFTSHVAYLNGTINHYQTDNDLGELEIYRDTISNLMKAVQHAVLLDLGNIEPRKNIFVNKSAVNQTFSPNLAPASVDPNSWGRDGESFYWGTVPTPYQTWAEALRGGKPDNITLGESLAQLPENSTIVTNYLCPSYQPKPLGSLLASVFVGTVTMLLTAWGAVTAASAMIAIRVQEPCKLGLDFELRSVDLGFDLKGVKCTCGSGVLKAKEGDVSIYSRSQVSLQTGPELELMNVSPRDSRAEGIQ